MWHSLQVSEWKNIAHIKGRLPRLKGERRVLCSWPQLPEVHTWVTTAVLARHAELLANGKPRHCNVIRAHNATYTSYVTCMAAKTQLPLAPSHLVHASVGVRREDNVVLGH